MKRGIILARKHGGKELTALGPALPYHEQVARFKRDFQANGSGTHDKYEEVVLIPVEIGVSKRVRFVTADRAKEIADAHAKAQEAAAKTATTSAEVKALGADVAAARAQVEHFERALSLAEKNNEPETKAKNVKMLLECIESAKDELKRAHNALKKAEAKTQKADAEANAKAEAETPTESNK